MKRPVAGLFLGLFGLSLVGVDVGVGLGLVAGPLLERGAQDVAERSTGIGGAVLRDRFLLLGDFLGAALKQRAGDKADADADEKAETEKAGE